MKKLLLFLLLCTNVTAQSVVSTTVPVNTNMVLLGKGTNFFNVNSNLLNIAVGNYNSTVNVRQYGAVGNGVTDDTAAFLAAVSSSAGEIIVPTGTYRINSQVVIPRSNLTIRGLPGSIITTPMTNLFDSVFRTISRNGITIDGLTFVAASHVPVYALRADLTTGVRFSHNNVTNMAGVLTRGFTNPTFPGVASTIVSTVATYNTALQSDIQITDNHFTGSWLPGQSTQLCANQLNYASRVTATGNKITGYAFGIFGAGGIRFWVETNGFGSATYTTTSTFTSTPPVSKQIIIANNTVTNSQAALWWAFSEDFSCTGNVVSGCTDVGLDAEICSGVTFAGNVVRNCKNGGIYFNDWCNSVTITGNTLITDENGLTANYSPGTLLRVDANQLSTNVTISGNSIINLTGTNLSRVLLANTSAGIVGLNFSGNTLYNVPVYSGRTAQGKSHLYDGNVFIHTNSLPGGFGALTINWASAGSYTISNNKFIWDVTAFGVASVAANQITLIEPATDILWGGAPARFATGDAVQYVGNASVLVGLDVRSIYYVNVVSDYVIKLYDTKANAIAGGATGLIPITSYSLGVLPSQIIQYKDSQYAIMLEKYSGGGYGSIINFEVRNNGFDWPYPLWAGTNPDIWALGSTNAIAAFLRNTGPMYINYEHNTFSGKVINPAVLRQDMLGYNGAIFHGENRMWSGQPAWVAPITNAFVMNRSVWYDTNWVVNANSGMLANRNGFWANSFGETAWASGRAYTIGDLVDSDNNAWVCAAPGTSSVAPTGVGNTNGIVQDGSLAWIYLSGFFRPVIPRSVGQLGFRSNSGTPYNVLTPNFLGEELLDSTSQVWWKSRSFGTGAQTFWNPISGMATTETLAYSGSNVSVSGRKGFSQISFLACTNNFTLNFVTFNIGDGGTIYVHPDTVAREFYTGSLVYSPNGITNSIPAGTGVYTNATIIHWRAIAAGGTNRIILTPSNVSR